MFHHYLLNELSPLNRHFVLLWSGLDSLELPINNFRLIRKGVVYLKKKLFIYHIFPYFTVPTVVRYTVQVGKQQPIQYPRHSHALSQHLFLWTRANSANRHCLVLQI